MLSFRRKTYSPNAFLLSTTRLLFIIVIGFCQQTVFAQDKLLSGQVLNTDNEPLIHVLVYFSTNTQKATYTNEEGWFQIEKASPQDTFLIIQSMGYIDKRVQLSSLSSMEDILIILEEDAGLLQNINITAKSKNRLKKETGFNVELLDTKQFQNLNADINQILKAVSGVNVREAGGLGSGFNLSLNGLSGNQVRYFMDGVPMENFGSSLQLNNFSTNLIETVEVYKGVVPIHLAADALGGAINIITNDSYDDFLDVSYSIGSFNTQRLSLAGKHMTKDNKFYLLSSLFINHSDNNYTMDSVKVFDLNLGNLLGVEQVERFNDQYTSGMVRMTIGSSTFSWADDISLGVTVSKNRNNFQNPDNNILRPLGQFNTRSTSLLSSFQYNKKQGKIDVSTNVTIGRIASSTIDTSTLKYNWRGESIRRSEDDPKGEVYERRSLFKLTDNIVRAGINVDYQLNESNSITSTFSLNQTLRSGEDEVDELNFAFSNTNRISKKITAGSYNYKSPNGLIQTSLFVKGYFFSGFITSRDEENREVVSNPSFENIGYGIANKITLGEIADVKASYENAYRLPEAYEILGDGIYVNSNPLLAPESSHNINLGLISRHAFGELGLTADFNYFYRSSADFIRFLPLGPFGQYENLINVRSTGFEGGFNFNYKKIVDFSTNATYQNITDQNEFDEGLANTNYQSRVPNIPFFFVNSRLGITPYKGDSISFSIYGSTRYVHDFFLNWSALGSTESKNIIPAQRVHNIEVLTKINRGKYNLSLSVNNITDAQVFDNFNIQKPGRSFTVKFRYLYK